MLLGVLVGCYEGVHRVSVGCWGVRVLIGCWGVGRVFIGCQ